MGKHIQRIRCLSINVFLIKKCASLALNWQRENMHTRLCSDIHVFLLYFIFSKANWFITPGSCRRARSEHLVLTNFMSILQGLAWLGQTISVQTCPRTMYSSSERYGPECQLISGEPGLVDRVLALHAGSRGFDSHRGHMSEQFFRSNKPGYPYPVSSDQSGGRWLQCHWTSAVASAFSNRQNCTCAHKTLQIQRGQTHGAGCVRQWFRTAEPLGERRYENWNTHTHTHTCQWIDLYLNT